jgi:hypothetical protein
MPTEVLQGVGDRRCTATSKSGLRCEKSALLGQTICLTHGGSASHALKAAQHRLLCAAEPAVGWLVEFIESKKGFCDTCKRSDDESTGLSTDDA